MSSLSFMLFLLLLYIILKNLYFVNLRGCTFSGKPHLRWFIPLGSTENTTFTEISALSTTFVKIPGKNSKNAFSGTFANPPSGGKIHSMCVKRCFIGTLIGGLTPRAKWPLANIIFTTIHVMNRIQCTEWYSVSEYLASARCSLPYTVPIRCHLPTPPLGKCVLYASLYTNVYTITWITQHGVYYCVQHRTQRLIRYIMSNNLYTIWPIQRLNPIQCVLYGTASGASAGNAVWSDMYTKSYTYVKIYL